MYLCSCRCVMSVLQFHVVIVCANVEHDRMVVEEKNVRCVCVRRFNDVADVQVIRVPECGLVS